jgi:hypothetical protein
VFDGQIAIPEQVVEKGLRRDLPAAFFEGGCNTLVKTICAD